MGQGGAIADARTRSHAAPAERARPLPRQDRWQSGYENAPGARRLPESERDETRLLAERRRAQAHASRRRIALTCARCHCVFGASIRFGGFGQSAWATTSLPFCCTVGA